MTAGYLELPNPDQSHAPSEIGDGVVFNGESTRRAKTTTADP